MDNKRDDCEYFQPLILLLFVKISIITFNVLHSLFFNGSTVFTGARGSVVG
jgi:hypothetical protein